MDYYRSTARPVVTPAAGSAAYAGGGGGPPPSLFATWDPARKGTGVTLSAANLRADINGTFMVAMTNPLDISGPQLYYAELTVNSGAFLGVGISISTSATDQFQGAYPGQCTVWQDASVDNGGGMSNAGNRPNYAADVAAHAIIQICIGGGQFYFGVVGRGWWDPVAGTWTGDPAAALGRIIYLINPGLYSLGISSISTANVTLNSGASAWAGVPPSGAIGFPA